MDAKQGAHSPRLPNTVKHDLIPLPCYILGPVYIGPVYIKVGIFLCAYFIHF